jgi:UDP-N-acetylglucosamine diphosphorylase/glucosamine-1-phosphate N-acetyltransferase
MRLVVCETSLRENFYPLTYSRLAGDLLFGTGTFLEKIEKKSGNGVTDLFVPPYLAPLARRNHPKLRVNEPIPEECIAINSLISFSAEMWKYVQNALKDPGKFLAKDGGGNVVFGRLAETAPESFGNMASKKIPFCKILQMPESLSNECLIRYPWDLVDRNSLEITSDFDEKRSSSVGEQTSYEIKGKNVRDSQSSEIERFVTLDSRKGPIIIEDNVEIQSFSHLTGPCFIGKKSQIKSAKIRPGTTIGENCKVSGEVEATIFSEFSNKSHDGFLGHSLIGSWVNLGALTTNSDLKNTYGKIKSNLGRKSFETGRIKVGIIVGDMAKTAVGTLIMAGKKIGIGSHVFGTVVEDVPSFTMYGKSLAAKSAEINIDSVLTTQRRMMDRRGLPLSSEMEAVIRSVYKITKSERAFQRVTKRRFRLS